MSQALVLKIGEFAGRVGVTPDALRYYERVGLLPRPQRTDGGYRLYFPAATQRLRFIKQAQANGLSLAEIRELLALQRGGSGSCRHVQQI